MLWIKRVVLSFFDCVNCVLIATALVIVIGSVSGAATLPLRVKPGKTSPAIESGVLFGGEAREEFSVIAIHHETLRNGTERLQISYGDRTGAQIHGRPGYFHAAFDRNSRRLVLDLAQVTRTAVDQKDLVRILARSSLIASSDMTMDPQDNSTNITLNLKQPSVLSISEDKDVPGRLTIEFRKAGAKPKAGAGA